MGVTETNFHVKQGLTGTGDWKVYDVGGSRTQRSAWVPFFDDGVSAHIFHSMRVRFLLSVNAILFLAPISAFDQRLEEDPNVSRIEDSMLLWREICRNRLLMNVDLILFLNKVDLLRKKLEDGVQFNKYLTQYKDANTVAAVCKCEESFPFCPRALVHGADGTSAGLGLTRFYLVDFENKFIAIHRDGLKKLYANLQNPAKNGGKVEKLPEAERKLKIHCTSVIDMESTQKIIWEGVSPCFFEKITLC
jgi:hypothetical protein